MAAIALYGDSVSWQYLAAVRGNGTVRNLLDPELVSIHHKIADFCFGVGCDPGALLDPFAPLDTVTLDGRPFSNPRLVSSIRNLYTEEKLPNLLTIISQMFLGASKGWTQFTEEFHPGGTYDSLTKDQLQTLFIPATNDVNEGALGSWRVHVRYHPNSTARSFSSTTRAQRNNTEQFIVKVCDDNDHQYVRRLARIQDASKETLGFRQRLLKAYRDRAEAHRLREEARNAKKQERLYQLTQVGLVTDRKTISEMTVKALEDQLDIYIMILGDEVLRVPGMKSKLKVKVQKLFAILAAVTRYEKYVLILLSDKLLNLSSKIASLRDVVSRGRGEGSGMSERSDNENQGGNAEEAGGEGGMDVEDEDFD